MSRLAGLVELTRVRFFEFVREREAVFWVYVFPGLVAIGLGIAFREKQPDKHLIAVDSRLNDATQLVDQARGSDAIRAKAMDADQARRALGKSRIALFVSRPQKASAQLTYLLHFDPMREEARVARLAVRELLLRGRSAALGLKFEDVPVREHGSRYIDFLIPGLLGLNLMGTAIWGVGYAVVSARTKSLLRRFAVTPMRRSHFVMSFGLSRLIFLLPEVSVLLAFSWLLFDVEIRGSLLTIALFVLVGSFAFLGIALLIAARPRSIEAASGWMNLVMMPMWLLSGSFFSYERFPEIVHPLIKALPLTALNDALRATINQGTSLWSLWSQLVILLAWGAVTLPLSLKIFRWK